MLLAVVRYFCQISGAMPSIQEISNYVRGSEPRSPRGTVCRGPNLTSGEVWFCHGERIGHPQSQVVEVGDPGIGEHAMNIGGQGVKKGDVLSRRDQMDLPSNLRWQYNYDAPTPDQNTRSFFSI